MKQNLVLLTLIITVCLSACSTGNTVCTNAKDCYRMGVNYEQKQDYDHAKIYFEKAAEQGNADAQAKLGLMYYAKEQDYSKAVEWFKKSAQQGNAIGQYGLGSMYSLGCGVPRDDKQAFEWVNKSAQQGLINAQETLGIFYLEGKGVEPDYHKAFELLKKSAEQGRIDAQFRLGIMYRDGKGVTQNLSQARNYFNQAQTGYSRECNKGMQTPCNLVIKVQKEINELKKLEK